MLNSHGKWFTDPNFKEWIVAEASRQDCKNIFSIRQVHKAGLQFLLQRSYVWEFRKHLFSTEVILDSSISRTWAPHTIFLSGRNDLVFRNRSFKEMITGSAPPLLSTVSSHFIFVFALSQFTGPKVQILISKLSSASTHYNKALASCEFLLNQKW